MVLEQIEVKNQSNVWMSQGRLTLTYELIYVEINWMCMLFFKYNLTVNLTNFLLDGLHTYKETFKRDAPLNQVMRYYNCFLSVSLGLDI